MKFLITESELKRFIINYMNHMYNPDYLDVLETCPDVEKVCYQIYTKNDENIFMYNKTKNYFLFDFENVWSYFLNDLGLNPNEIKSGLKEWTKYIFGVEDPTIFVR